MFPEQIFKILKIFSMMYVLCLLVSTASFRVHGFPSMLEFFPVGQCLPCMWSTVSLELNFSGLISSDP